MRNKITILILGLIFSLKGLSQENCTLSYAAEVKYANLNNKVKIAYQEAGKGKETLLLIHGLGGNLSHWKRNINELSKKHRVIAVDLPNYGMSSKGSYDVSDGALVFYAQVVNAFIKKKRLKNVTLIGHSMGGQTAMLTALNFPKSVSKLIIAAPAGIETFTEQEAKMLSGFVNPEASKAQNEAAIRQSFKLNFVEVPAETEVLIQDRLMLPKCSEFDPYWAVVAQGVNGMLKNVVFERLGELKQATLIIFGDKDALIPNRYLHSSLTTEKVAQTANIQIKGSQLEVISEAGHMVMFEKPAEFNETVIKFLKK